MNFIWSCMTLSLKAGLGTVFWAIGILVIIAVIGAGAYLLNKR